MHDVTYKSGDVVRLKSGGPSMTVRYAASVYVEGPLRYVDCIWTSADGIPQERRYPVDAVEPAWLKSEPAADTRLKVAKYEVSCLAAEITKTLNTLGATAEESCIHAAERVIAENIRLRTASSAAESARCRYNIVEDSIILLMNRTVDPSEHSLGLMVGAIKTTLSPKSTESCLDAANRLVTERADALAQVADLKKQLNLINKRAKDLLDSTSSALRS